mgnify:CR=1 FL=1
MLVFEVVVECREVAVGVVAEEIGLFESGNSYLAISYPILESGQKIRNLRRNQMRFNLFDLKIK